MKGEVLEGREMFEISVFSYIELVNYFLKYLIVEF